MSANADWLKAYEEQKAKALERLTAAKEGRMVDTNVSGLSGTIQRPSSSGPAVKKRPAMVPKSQGPVPKGVKVSVQVAAA